MMLMQFLQSCRYDADAVPVKPVPWCCPGRWVFPNLRTVPLAVMVSVGLVLQVVQTGLGQIPAQRL
ncbi:MAG: hypothetical protein ACLFS0_08545 [Bacteroidales bacterium]